MALAPERRRRALTYDPRLKLLEYQTPRGEWVRLSLPGVTDPIPAHVAAADPHTQYQKESEKGAADGYASLSSSSIVPDAQLAASGTADSTTFLRGDRTWAAPSGGGLTAAQAGARVVVGV